MSDNTTLGGALYGPDGPASGPQGPNWIDEGRASPSAPPAPTPSAPIPTATKPALTESAPRLESQSQSQSQSLSDKLYGAGPTQPFDPGRISMPEGLEADPALMTEFSKEAQALKLDQAGADRLVQLHAKALQGWHDQHAATAEGWRKETE